MPTSKPRFTITVDDELYEQITSYRFDHRLKNQTQAVIALVSEGLKSFDRLKNECEKASTLDNSEMGAQLKKIINQYNGMNPMGKNELAKYADYLESRPEYSDKHSNIPSVKEA